VSSSIVPSSNMAVDNNLVVVHTANGLTKGTLEWHAGSECIVPPTPLPDVLHIKCGSSGEDKTIPVCETKAVFFVKNQQGNHEHDDVKFFAGVTPHCLWVRIQFADGEELEGRAENSLRLLFDPGIWVRPLDTIANNFLVYIPKSSVVDFHIMGVADFSDGRSM
jgi:Family of unknown function (DUF6982)